MYSVLTWSRASTEPRYPVLKLSIAKWPRKSPNGAFISSVYYHKITNYPPTNNAVPSWLSLLEMLVKKVQYQFIQNSAHFRAIINPSLNRELYITTLSLTNYCTMKTLLIQAIFPGLWIVNIFTILVKLSTCDFFIQ